MTRVFSILKVKQKTYTSYGLGQSWKILQKNNLHEFRSIESLIFDRLSPTDLHNKSCSTLDSNFTQKYTLSSLNLD